MRAARGKMELRNSTDLSTERLRAMILPHALFWRCDRLTVDVRWSRGADFSGSCRYDKRVITVNIGRHVVFPYRMDTHVARPRRNRTAWWRPACIIELRDAYQLVLFVFLHELYHWLVKQARRSVRQKEGMCDRFAARVLVDEYECEIRDAKGKPVPREEWDFQRLTSFVAAARRKRSNSAMPIMTRTGEG